MCSPGEYRRYARERMRILIELLHPAHVHVFRNFVRDMESRGHVVMLTARDKDVTVDLLREYGLPHEILSSQAIGTIGLARELVTRVRSLNTIIKQFQPDVLTGIMGPTIAVAGRRRRVPAVVFYDTEFATRTNRWVYRLAHTVITPDSYQNPVPGLHVTYPGYHELAYLHPNRFTPDPQRVRAAGVDPDELFSLVRFVSWDASHDVGEIALTAEQKRTLVDHLAASGRVLISSEKPLPPDLEPFAWRGARSDIHHLIAYAQLVVGESATMASEAAVLGTPAVYIAKTGRGYTDDQEARYGLVRNVQPTAFETALEAVDSYLSTPTQDIAAGHKRLLEERIDVTEWMVDWFEGTSFER